MDTSHLEIVIEPYSDNWATHLKKDLPRLKGLKIRGDWNTDYISFIKKHNIEALYFNYTWGWTETDYRFLNDLTGIKQLDILTKHGEHFDSIANLTDLRYLGLDVKDKIKECIYFGQLTQLKEASFIWDSSFADIFNCQSLESLSVLGAKHVPSEQYSRLNTLKKLTISSSNISHLEFLLNMPNLQQLELYHCKKITDFRPVAQCHQLEWLAIENNDNLHTIDFVGNLNKLYYLNLSNNKELGSFQVLRDLTGLKALIFTGNTIIKDGDLTVLTQLPTLSMLMFNPRRHYTHKLIKNWNWSNLENPDVLLKEKQ